MSEYSNEPPKLEQREPDGKWERKVLEKLAFATLKEQRARRYWGIFFKLLTFGYITFILVSLMHWRGNDADAAGPHTALVELSGVIESDGNSSAENINNSLASAFKDNNTKGVILRINSPGGSPVQSGIIYDEIRRLRGLHPAIPLYVVVEDVCASGGYFVAAAADKIFVNKASIVGSIGVLMDGFGFTGVMDKVGVERRLITAGTNKGFMDPFSPVDEKQKAYAKQMLADVHQQFIDVVKRGRGERLKETPETFSGLMWTGAKSVEMGLADGFGSVDFVAREIIKAENIVDYSAKENIAERFAKRLGASAMGTLLSTSYRQHLSLK